jgi:hypothetical protein
MKIDLEYNELLDVADALRARAPVFERPGMKVCQASNIGTARLRTIARSPIRSWQIDVVEVVTVAGRQAFLPGAQAVRIRAKRT